MKIIFLDIDGVLNSIETYEKVKQAHKKGLTLNYGPRGTIYNLHDKQMVANLNRIIKKTGAFIVLSSCWRYGLNSQGELKALLNKILKIKGGILGKTPEFDMNKTRANEIQAWINFKLPYYEERLGKLESFIVLDDDGCFGHLQKYLVRTDKFKGLTNMDADNAIGILNSANK